jgi:BirA family transcriptional regulator, biotin operon repressor / biotin---[acetyl-CoA-carboxylase] ligase
MTSGRFDQLRFEAERAVRGLELGLPVSWQDVTESTNDDALRAAKDGAPHGALFGAETQTRGRGRRGSAWLSTPGAGLWFSVLLRPQLRPELLPGLSLCAGLAVRAAVAARVAAPTQVKWPNDVWAGGRKISGILVESQVSAGSVTSVIVGIGLNVTQAAFPEELANVATSLTLLSARALEREPLLADVLSRLQIELQRLTEGGLGAVADELRPHDALLGRRLRVDALEGVGDGIDADGRLRLRRADGHVDPVLSGHVERLD